MRYQIIDRPEGTYATNPGAMQNVRAIGGVLNDVLSKRKENQNNIAYRRAAAEILGIPEESLAHFKREKIEDLMQDKYKQQHTLELEQLKSQRELEKEKIKSESEIAKENLRQQGSSAREQAKIQQSQAASAMKNVLGYQEYMNKALAIDPQNQLAKDVMSKTCDFVCAVEK